MRDSWNEERICGTRRGWTKDKTYDLLDSGCHGHGTATSRGRHTCAGVRIEANRDTLASLVDVTNIVQTSNAETCLGTRAAMSGGNIYSVANSYQDGELVRHLRDDGVDHFGEVKHLINATLLSFFIPWVSFW